MSVDDVLKRLLALRRRNEQQALDLLMRSQAEARRAAEALETAEDKVLRHRAEQRAREREELRALLGTRVRPEVILDLQDKLDAMAREEGRLEAAGETARQDLAERTSAVQDAQEAFRTRQRAAIKLAMLTDHRARTILRRQEALADDASDEAKVGGGAKQTDGRRA
jgi:hypothetical protein